MTTLVKNVLAIGLSALAALSLLGVVLLLVLVLLTPFVLLTGTLAHLWWVSLKFGWGLFAALG